MFVAFFLNLTGRDRNSRSNLILGCIMALIAGAVNAGGFLAIQQYTSHMTGVVTDIGIELGRLLYWNRSKHLPPDENVRANRQKLNIYLSIFFAFLTGGILGALAFKEVGYFTTVPIAIFLLLLAAPPILRDIFTISKHKRRDRHT